MDWQIQVSSKAEKSLKKIPDPYKSKLKKAIDHLPQMLNSYKTKKLSGSTRNLYRLRVGQYRIVYRLYADKKILLLVRIGHRKDVYDNL